MDYSFFEVWIEEARIFRDMNCGNITAAVGPFAIDEGIVLAMDGVQTVRIHATNFDKIIYADVPVENGRAKILGAQHIEGVPGAGAPIHLDWRDTAGGHTGRLLPTGNLRDTLHVDGLGDFDISVVDLANVVAYLRADAVGLTGGEDPLEMSRNAALMARCEPIRLTLAVKLGLAPNLEAAYRHVPPRALDRAGERPCGLDGSRNEEQPRRVGLRPVRAPAHQQLDPQGLSRIGHRLRRRRRSVAGLGAQRGDLPHNCRERTRAHRASLRSLGRQRRRRAGRAAGPAVRRAASWTGWCTRRSIAFRGAKRVPAPRRPPNGTTPGMEA